MRSLLIMILCATVAIGSIYFHEQVANINPKDHEFLGMLSTLAFICWTIFMFYLVGGIRNFVLNR